MRLFRPSLARNSVRAHLLTVDLSQPMLLSVRRFQHPPPP